MPQAVAKISAVGTRGDIKGKLFVAKPDSSGTRSSEIRARREGQSPQAEKEALNVPRRSNPFQRLVLLLNDCAAGRGVTVAESKEMVDKTTGRTREVDIVLTSRIAETSVVISIEVTDSRRLVDVTWVEQQIHKHESLATDKLVLVSRSGFTAAAVSKAQFHNVDTLTIDEASQVDWPEALRLLGDGFFQLVHLHFECSAVVGDESEPRPIPLRTVVDLPYRDEPTDVEAMARYFLAHPTIKHALDEQVKNTENREFTLDYTTQPGTCIRGQPKQVIRQLIIELTVDVRRTPVTYSFGRLQSDEILWATAKPGHGNLTVALRRSPDGNVVGRLLDEGEIRALHLERQ